MKRFFALALAFVLCFSLLGVTALATESAYLYVGPATAGIGENVTLYVSLGNNPGIMGMQITISYDDTLLEKVSYQGIGMNGGVWTIVNNAVWDNGSDDTYNGTILALTFKVKDSAKVGDVANVSVSCVAGNSKGEYVSVGGSTGTVTVICNHVWDNGVVTKAHTCFEDGEKTYTCTKCGETKTEAIPAAHDWETIWSYDAENHWHKCSVCGEIKDKDIHHMDVVAEQAPTKEEDGWLLWGCHECDYEWREVWEYGEEPKVGDIRPMILMTITGVVAFLAAAAFVFKRKNVI